MNEGKARILSRILYIHLGRLFPASVMFSNYVMLVNDFTISEPFLLLFKIQIKKKVLNFIGGEKILTVWENTLKAS